MTTGDCVICPMCRCPMRVQFNRAVTLAAHLEELHQLSFEQIMRLVVVTEGQR